MKVAERILTELTNELLLRAGADPHESKVIANVLIWCDKVGRSTQGVWRLETFCGRLEGGGIKSPCDIAVTGRGTSILKIDGNDGSGHYVCHEAALLGIAAARDAGCVAVAVQNSNHCGALGYYAWLAAEAGLIAFLWSNAYAKVASHLGNKPVLGTNPMAFAAPRPGAPPIVVDMSTSAIAGSSVRLAIEEGVALDPGTAEMRDGRPLNEPALLESGFLLPFGGAKGYALGLVGEILCGVLASSQSSRDVRSLYGDPAEGGKNGQFMILLDPSVFVSPDEYSARLDGIIKAMTVDNGQTRLPGDARWLSFQDSERLGIEVSPHSIEGLSKLCARYNVRIPSAFCA